MTTEQTLSRYAGPMAIRRLTPGERVPEGTPRRYRQSHGYWVLRWKVGKRSYVDVYEHRVTDGIVTDAEHVHHINGIKGDNRPENLMETTGADHMKHHRLLTPEQEAEVVGAYVCGARGPELAERIGCQVGTIYRTLDRYGIPRREANESRHLGRFDDDEIERRYNAGERPASIGRALGHSRGPVDRVIRERGLERHPPGRPAA